MLIVWLMLLVGLLGPASPALAAPQVSLQVAPDGTLTVIGDGWRPGQHMAVSVSATIFLAFADSTGSFEIQTGLLSKPGPPPALAVLPPNAVAALEPPARPPDTANPLAVAFAEGLAAGIRLAVLSAAGVILLALASRLVRVRRFDAK